MHTMALDESALLELLDALNAADAGDVVRQALERVFQALIEVEATAVIGAEPHQRTPDRVAQRNGYRDRLLTTCPLRRAQAGSCPPGISWLGG
jgi:putative transposase